VILTCIITNINNKLLSLQWTTQQNPTVLLGALVTECSQQTAEILIKTIIHTICTNDQYQDNPQKKTHKIRTKMRSIVVNRQARGYLNN